MPGRKVLVTIENRFASRYILEALLKRRWLPQTEFMLVHVMEAPLDSDLPRSYWIQRKRLRKGVQFLLNDMAEQIKNLISDSIVTTEIREGRAREQILYLAERWQADLIVMGTHAHTGLNRLLIGSVALPVSAHAPCSVLVVKSIAAKHNPEYEREQLAAGFHMVHPN